MDRERLPSKPIITSLASANAQISQWLQKNDRRWLQDGDGAKWNLKVKVTQKPDPNSTQGGLWEIRLGLSAALGARELVETNTLEPRGDARLISMIGDQQIEFALKPVTYHSHDEDEARLWLAEAVENLQDRLLSRSLSPIKRELIARWVDQRCHFASHPERC